MRAHGLAAEAEPIAQRPGLRPVLGPLAVMAVVYLVDAWDRVVVPVELVEVRRAYGLSLSGSSLIASVFTFGLALTALPAGLLVARWGMRTTLVVGASCSRFVPPGSRSASASAICSGRACSPGWTRDSRMWRCTASWLG